MNLPDLMFKNRFRGFDKPFRAVWLMLLLSATALLYIVLTGNATSGSLLLWGWGTAMAAATLNCRLAHPEFAAMLTAWVLLAAAVAVTALRPISWNLSAGFLGAAAVIFFVGGLQLGWRLLPSAFILLVLAPSQSFLMMLLSLPLSRICAELTVGCLNLLGVAANCANAVILIGGERIAVTSACSGIELIEAMLFLSWLIVLRGNNGLLRKTVYFSMIFPLTILCNTLRLVVVILLYLEIGDAALEGTIHTVGGIAAVVAIVLLMLALGPLFRRRGDR